MSLAMVFFLNIMLIAIECMTFILLFGEIFYNKQKSASYRMPVIIGFVASEVLILQIIGQLIAFHSLFILIPVTAWQLYALHNEAGNSFFTPLLKFSGLVIIDNVIVSVAAIITKSNELLENPYVYYAFCCCVKMVKFFVVALVFTGIKSQFHWRAVTIMGRLRELIFPSSMLVAGVLLGWTILKQPYLARVLLWLSMVLLVADVGSVLLLEHLSRQREAIFDNIVLRQNLKLEEEHILSMEKAYTLQRKQVHDFENRLAVLRDMAEQNVPQAEFAHYLNGLLSTEMHTVLYVNTHRTVVDIIISQKIPLANDKGIDFRFRLDDLSDFPLPDDALVVVLTNLIDNAIEACERIPQNINKRSILLKIKMDEDSAFLSIENTTKEPVVIKNNLIRTTKENKLEHGYGLKNIAAMITRNGGEYFIDYRDADGVFCFCATIPCSEKTE